MIEEVLKPKTDEEIKDLESRGFCVNSGKWKFVIKIDDLITEASKTRDVAKFRNELVSVLEKKTNDISLLKGDKTKESYESVIEKFKTLNESFTEKDIDDALNSLYDWADDNDVWVKSFNEE